MKKGLSVFDLLVRQVSALVIETVDFACPEGQDIQDILAVEAQCYHVLAVNCAVKHKALRKLSKQASKNKKPGKAATRAKPAKPLPVDASARRARAARSAQRRGRQTSRAPSASPRTSAKTGRGAQARGH